MHYLSTNELACFNVYCPEGGNLFGRFAVLPVSCIHVAHVITDPVILEPVTPVPMDLGL